MNAYKEKVVEFAGAGAAVQFAGLLVLGGGIWKAVTTHQWLFFLLGGLIAGTGLLVLGSEMSKRLICSNCGNSVGKASNICPTCKADFNQEIEVT